MARAVVTFNLLAPSRQPLRAQARALAHDSRFALALVAGPVVWLSAVALSGATVEFGWVLTRPLHFASVAVAWPLLEEWIFRGLLQPAIGRTVWGARSAWGISTANALTSLGFAAAHLVSHAPAWAAATLVPSLVFGYFRDRHGSILPAATLHIYYNLGWFLFLGA
jgi:uncharacterized protein